MLKRLAAAGAVTAAMGGVLLTASPALAGDCGHGPHGHHGHHGGHGYGHGHGGGYGYHHRPHDVIDNKNTNINRPVVIVNQAPPRQGLLGGLLGAIG